MKNNKRKPKLLLGILNSYQLLGVLLWVAAFILILTPLFPHVWYRVNAGAVDNDISKLRVTFEDINNKYRDVGEYEPQIQLPVIDKVLSETNSVIIPSIGVNSPVTGGRNFEKALEKGTWIVNDFGTPDKNKQPIILAAHRFGYITWTSKQRNQLSFFNLPKTKIGDTVEIVWDQREYIYEIYDIEKGTNINDYDADLILYTCELYNSPVRIFRYAKRVN